MVGAGKPKGRDSGHSAPTGEGVLNGLFQGMTKVQLPGDVGRWHDDHVGLFAFFDGGVEIAFGLPVFVDALFNVGRVVSAGHLGGSHCRN